MTDKIDMSLDDIIKRKSTPGKARRGGKFGNRTPQSSRGGRRNTNVKKIGASSRQMKPNRGSQKTFTNKPTRDLPEKWLHDKFASEIKSSSLTISNLHYGVSDQDIRELFSEFGPLKKVAVHYDSSGRSLGKADVVFVKTSDAIRAIKKYNGVPLDGRPMNIQAMVSTAIKASIASRIGNGGDGLKKAGQLQQRGRPRVVNNRARRGTGRGGGKIGLRNQRSGPRKQPTVAELDADLDAYTNKV